MLLLIVLSLKINNQYPTFLRLFNTKSFAVTILVFFSFFFLVQFSAWTAKKFLSNVLRLVIKESCDLDLAHSLDTPKKNSVRIVPEVVICNTCGTWHSLFIVASIHSTQKAQEIPKQVNHWLRVKTGRNRVDKSKSLKKKKSFSKGQVDLVLHANHCKNCCWRTFVIRKCTNIQLVVDDHDEVP